MKMGTPEEDKLLGKHEQQDFRFCCRTVVTETDTAQTSPCGSKEQQRVTCDCTQRSLLVKTFISLSLSVCVCAQARVCAYSLKGTLTMVTFGLTLI